MSCFTNVHFNWSMKGKGLTWKLLLFEILTISSNLKFHEILRMKKFTDWLINCSQSCNENFTISWVNLDTTRQNSARWYIKKSIPVLIFPQAIRYDTLSLRYINIKPIFLIYQSITRFYTDQRQDTLPATVNKSGLRYWHLFIWI